MKKIFALMLCLMLVACSFVASAEETGGKRIAVSFMTLNNPFWVAENETLKTEVEARGGTLYTYDAAMDMETQIFQIEDAVNSGVDAILISPLDWKGIRPALEACNAAETPVVILDTKAYDGDLVNAQVVSDNYLGGQLCAEALISVLGESFNVAILDLSTNMAVQDRTDGFFSVIDQYPDIKVVARQDGDGSVEKALPIMENMLQSNPEIQAVFGTNDPAAIGCIAAIQTANRGDIYVVGIDGAKDSCDLIRNGQMLGTAAQYPSKLATRAVEEIYEIFNGKVLADEDKIIYVDEAWVSIDNVEEYEANSAY